MKLPVIRGVIDRRILANYRVDPDVLAATLPAPFRPKLHGGRGIAGICLIRLRDLRPRFAPGWMGMRSENAAHRTSVLWDDADGNVREGVYIRHRDSNSWLNALGGGRIFPGLHSHAKFTVHETATHLEVALRSDDNATRISVVGDVAVELPATSSFASLAEASAFFEAGALGYSPTHTAGAFEGMKLQCRNWSVEPLAITEIHSSYFDDQSVFPRGSIEFDCALLMRGIDHEWRSEAELCCSTMDD